MKSQNNPDQFNSIPHPHMALWCLLLAMVFKVTSFAEDPLALDAERGIRFHPVKKQIEGWTVFVEPALLGDGEDLAGKKALRMLRNHLQRIKILVPLEPLKKDARSGNLD